GIGRDVPMNDGVAPPVKVDALLTDTGGREHERPERAVERSADLGQSGVVVASALGAVAQGEPRGDRDGLRGVIWVEGLVAGGAEGDGASDFVRDLGERGVVEGRTASTGDGVVEVLVEDGLKVSVGAVAQDG